MDGKDARFSRKGMVARHLVRLEAGAARQETDAVAVEEPLEIRVDGEVVAVTMRTPGQDAELALGFLFAEGIIAGAGDVGTVAYCGRPGEETYGNVIDVRSAGGAPIDVERVLEGRRWSLTSSACGVCGRRSIQSLLDRCGPIRVEMRLPRGALSAFVERLAAAQPVFMQTGGLHAAALFSQGGRLLASAEDVGRHNAVDKAVGALIRRKLVGAPSPRHDGHPGGTSSGDPPAVLAVSGRASFEIVQKAAAAQIPFVASVSAPSSLAVDMADQAGIALVGFVRGGRLNVYANAWRLEETFAEHPASP